ncbi:unnamed protein product [Brachionus calyciflorus]|uniref:Integrase catalytic domain-containing protein n=1 Tax=Brachionus calyciflorus TaxID=104777 RepID=A0A814KZZ0_9BILA|nr:unnamed protein product [Brachionus calyciflorus]
MIKEAKKYYSNVTRRIVELFLDYSEEYQVKKFRNHGLIVKPIRSNSFNERMQIDLIDFRTMPDGEYCWILNAQDHFCKVCWLRPLKDKSTKEVARALIDIFGHFGAPKILQSDNGKEFRNSIIEALKLFWPDLTLVHGRARRPQTQGSVDRSNGDVQNILGSWMRANKSTNWSMALSFVQLIKNNKFNEAKQLFNLLGKNTEANDFEEDDNDDDINDNFDLVSDELLKIRDELISSKLSLSENDQNENQDNQDENDLNQRANRICKARNEVKKMLKKNKKLINSFNIGGLVLFRTDDVDRNMADAQNIFLYNFR